MSEVTHMAGEDGVMPCCGKTPWEADMTDRITISTGLVTCTGSKPEPYTPTTEEVRNADSAKPWTPTTQYVVERYADDWQGGTTSERVAQFDRWLAEHDKKVIAKAFHEWADFQIDSLRVAPTTDEDYEEAKRYADAAKYWADNIILKGETE